jgi:hypothetical protein
MSVGWHSWRGVWLLVSVCLLGGIVGVVFVCELDTGFCLVFDECSFLLSWILSGVRFYYYIQVRVFRLYR